MKKWKSENSYIPDLSLTSRPNTYGNEKREVIMLNPNNTNQHPWGNEPLESEEHAQWLVRKLTSRIDRKIREYPGRDPLRIDLGCDLVSFQRAFDLLKEEAENAGWDLKVIKGFSLGEYTSIELTQQKVTT